MKNTITVFSIRERDAWNSVVQGFVNYDVYYLSGYVKAFQLHGDGEPTLIYFNNGNTKAINVVMKRDIAKDSRFEGKIPPDTYFDFVTPYGYGGWLIEGEDREELFRTYETWCKENNVVSEFVRFHPVLKNENVNDFYEVVPLGNTVALDLVSEEVIWSNFSSKNRNVIRKAQKNGIEISHGRDWGLFKEFQSIYNATMDKDEAKDYYYFGDVFYESILKDLENNAQVFYAVHTGQIIAASIMIYANGRLNYHLSGSLREFQHLAPSNLLLFKAAKWGYQNGYRTFHLGGGVGSKEDSLYKFKKAFYRGEPKRFYIGKKMFAPDVYDLLVGFRTNEGSSNYFPKYRA